MRVGIYPGTFDPIHIGHIAFAQESRKQLQLDEVVFLPEDQPRGKQNVTPRSTRMQQIKVALQEHDGLSAIELEKGLFTVRKTLPHLHGIYPDAQLTLLIGSDVVQGLENWQDIERLLGQMSLVIGMRTGSRQDEMVATINKLEKQYGLHVDLRCVETPHAHIASSRLRKSPV